MNFRFVLFFAFFYLSAHADIKNASPSLTTQAYSEVLGNQDASAEYQALARTALKDLGLQNSEAVVVKKMNAVGSSIAGVDLSSFTAFGIWLDEAFLNTCSQDVKTFLIYHEAAHYVNNHHPKLLGQGLGIVLLTGLGLIALNSGLSKIAKISSLVKNSAVAGVGLASTVGFFKYVLPLLAKQQEKDADLIAASTLVKKGEDRIVSSYVEFLKLLPEQDQTHTWWPSVKDMIDYLGSILQDAK